MARISTVPVVVLHVAVQQHISTATHALNHRRAHRHRGYVERGHDHVVAQRGHIRRVHGLQGHRVKVPIGGVARADQTNELDGARREVEVLPGATQVRLVVDDTVPVLPVHAHLHVVRVGAVVAVPQQQFNVIDDADRAQLHNDSPLPTVLDRMPSEATFTIVAQRVAVQQARAQISFDRLRVEFRGRGDILLGPQRTAVGQSLDRCLLVDRIQQTVRLDDARRAHLVQQLFHFHQRQTDVFHDPRIIVTVLAAPLFDGEEYVDLGHEEAVAREDGTQRVLGHVQETGMRQKFLRIAVDERVAELRQVLQVEQASGVEYLAAIRDGKDLGIKGEEINCNKLITIDDVNQRVLK